MRKPKLKTFDSYDNTVTCTVSKKDFQLKKVEVVIRKAEGEEVRTIIPGSGRWMFRLAKEEVDNAQISVTDEADKVHMVAVASLE